MCEKRTVLLDTHGSTPESYMKTHLPIVGHLSGFDRVQVLVRPHARSLRKRKEEARHWELIRTYKASRRQPLEVVPFYDLYSTLQGPCDDWWRNIWLAFQDQQNGRDDQVGRIIYLTADIPMLYPAQTPDTRLQQFIDKANTGQYDLLLGNEEAFTLADVEKPFEPFLVPKAVAASRGARERLDICKNRIENLAVLRLQGIFPSTFAEFVKVRDDPDRDPAVRTGFFSLSRRMFEAFQQERGTMLPYGGTVQLLLCALIRSRVDPESLSVGEHFVGRLNHPAENPAEFRGEHQPLRTEFIIRNEHAYYSRKYPTLPL